MALCVKSSFVVFAPLSNVAAVELYYGIFAAVSLSQFLLPSHSCQVGASSQLQLVAPLHFISPLLVSTTTLSDFKLSCLLVSIYVFHFILLSVCQHVILQLIGKIRIEAELERF